MLDKLKQFFSDSSGKIKSFICIGLMITALGCILIDFKYRGNQKGHFTVYEEQLTLKYQGAKCALVDETQRYIDSVVELICDWLGAARAYMGDAFSYHMEYEWLMKKMSFETPKMHAYTQLFIMEVFKALNDTESDQVYFISDRQILNSKRLKEIYKETNI